MLVELKLDATFEGPPTVSLASYEDFYERSCEATDSYC